jgi:PhnB protein
MSNNKSSNSSHVPSEGYHTITPLLRVKDYLKLIDFLKQVFDAKEISRYNHTDGSIIHAEVKIGDSMIMISDSTEEWKPMTIALYLYVDDVDKKYQKALECSATSLREPRDEFYGDRCAVIVDNFGNQWWIASHNKNISEEKLDNSPDTYVDASQTFSI